MKRPTIASLTEDLRVEMQRINERFERLESVVLRMERDRDAAAIEYSWRQHMGLPDARTLNEFRARPEARKVKRTRAEWLAIVQDMRAQAELIVRLDLERAHRDKRRRAAATRRRKLAKTEAEKKRSRKNGQVSTRGV